MPPKHRSGFYGTCPSGASDRLPMSQSGFRKRVIKITPNEALGCVHVFLTRKKHTTVVD